MPFNIIISQIFPENFIEISKVAKEIWRFSASILTIFINFLDFLTFSCYKETNDIDVTDDFINFLPSTYFR